MRKDGLTPRQKKVWDKTGGYCAYCGVKLNPPSPTAGDRNRLCIDHIHARFNGGRDTFDNLAPACSHCNCVKRARSLEEFREIMLYKKYPRFTTQHIAYLKSLGIVLPQGFPCYQPYVFWFEQQGMTL